MLSKNNMEKGKLSKMKMPVKQEIDASELDLEGSPEDEALAGDEMVDQEDGDMLDAQAAPSQLESVADEDLLAEVQKRGLMKDLLDMEAPASGEPDGDEMPAAEEDELV